MFSALSPQRSELEKYDVFLEHSLIIMNWLIKMARVFPHGGQGKGDISKHTVQTKQAIMTSVSWGGGEGCHDSMILTC